MGWRGTLLREFLAGRNEIITGLSSTEARADLAKIRAHRTDVAPLISDVSALVIMSCARAASTLQGSMAEAGVFQGGTARLICEVKGSADLHLFDVFEKLQRPDIPLTGMAEEVLRYFGPHHGFEARVGELLAPYPGVHLHAGVFPGTAEPLTDTCFSFVHLDLDLERGTYDGLAFFYPRLVAGGLLIADDYQTPPVRQAFQRFFGDRWGSVITLPWGQGLVLKSN